MSSRLDGRLVQEPTVRPRPEQPIFLSTAERRVSATTRGALLGAAAVLAGAAAAAALLGRLTAAVALLVAAVAVSSGPAVRPRRRARASPRA